MFRYNPERPDSKQWLAANINARLFNPKGEINIILRSGCCLETLLLTFTSGVLLSSISPCVLSTPTPFMYFSAPNNLEVAISEKIVRAPHCPAGHVLITFLGGNIMNKVMIQSNKVIVLPPQNQLNTVE